MAFGNVNGLGVGPGAGLTTVAAAGGVIYSTPYLLNPAYGDFTSTTAATPTVITTTAADRSSITRYLGLFVGLNTAAPFIGTDSATLTYTMTVP